MDDMPADVYESDEAIVAEVHMPGVRAEDVNVYVEDDILRVVARREETREVDKDDYFSKEIRRGEFTRLISLPSAVDEDSVDATYENGVLKVWMEKA